MDVIDFKRKLVKEEALKKDNVSMEELVNIINEQKKEQKLLVPYQSFVASPFWSLMDKMRVISPKVKELAEIFMMAGEEMEWEKIKNQMKVEEATMKIKSLESVIKLREKLIKEAETWCDTKVYAAYCGFWKESAGNEMGWI